MRLNYALRYQSILLQKYFSVDLLYRVHAARTGAARAANVKCIAGQPYTWVQSVATSHTVAGRPSFRFTALIIKS